MPSGYSGEVGVRGDIVECSLRGGGGLPPSLVGVNLGECGGGGAFRGGRA